MISRSTLIGALVVVEFALVGIGARTLAGGAPGPVRPFTPLAPGSQFGWTADTGMGSTLLDKTFIAGLAPRVTVDVHDVHVVVETANVPTVRVTETRQWCPFSSKISAMTAQQTSEGVRVASAESSGGVHFFFGSSDRTLHLTVPENARLEILSSARVDAQGLRTKLVAHVPEGSIHVRDHRGDVDISTGDGRIELIDVQGSDIAANTRSGRIILTRVGADRFDAHTADGRIVAVDVRAVNGALTTESGPVTISFTGDSDATVNAHTDDGSVTVKGLSSTGTDAQSRVVRLGSGRGRFELSSGDDSIAVTQGANT